MLCHTNLLNIEQQIFTNIPCFEGKASAKAGQQSLFNLFSNNSQKYFRGWPYFRHLEKLGRRIFVAFRRGATSKSADCES